MHPSRVIRNPDIRSPVPLSPVPLSPATDGQALLSPVMRSPVMRNPDLGRQGISRKFGPIPIRRAIRKEIILRVRTRQRELRITARGTDRVIRGV